MKAIKDNKVYRITENEKKRYLEEGYDIYSDEGELQEHSPKKKITYAEHEKAIADTKAELKKVKAENEELRSKLKKTETTEAEASEDKKGGSKKAGD